MRRDSQERKAIISGKSTTLPTAGVEGLIAPMATLMTGGGLIASSLTPIFVPLTYQLFFRRD